MMLTIFICAWIIILARTATRRSNDSKRFLDLIVSAILGIAVVILQLLSGFIGLYSVILGLSSLIATILLVVEIRKNIKAKKQADEATHHRMLEREYNRRSSRRQ